MDACMLVVAILILIFLCCCRLLWLLVIIRKGRKLSRLDCSSDKKRKVCNTMIVMGSGGHTSEMIKLVSKLPDNYYPRTYLIADTDRFSEDKVAVMEANTKMPFSVHKIKRSREVHQSWSSTVITTLLAVIDCLKIFMRTKPDLLLCNGPGSCIPMCLVVFISRVLFFRVSTRIVFIESICRVQSLSLTGKILYYISDQFIVQWPQLTKLYPYTTYLGWIL